jgi:hypothetical protein
LFILELKPGAALQQGYPFMLRLVVPKTLGGSGGAGVNQLQAQARQFQQQPGGLLASRRTGTPQQVVITAGAAGFLPPAPANFEASAAGQLHHLLVAVAIAKGSP